MNLSKLFLAFLFFVSVVSIAQQKKYITYTVKKGENKKSIAGHLDYNQHKCAKNCHKPQRRNK